MENGIGEKRIKAQARDCRASCLVMMLTTESFHDPHCRRIAPEIAARSAFSGFVPTLRNRRIASTLLMLIPGLLGHLFFQRKQALKKVEPERRTQRYCKCGNQNSKTFSQPRKIAMKRPVFPVVIT